MFPLGLMFHLIFSPSLSPRRRTGTSQAVPFVAGVIALILQNSTRTAPADMSQLLAASAAKGRLSEVPSSRFASWDKVRCLAVIGWGSGDGCVVSAAPLGCVCAGQLAGAGGRWAHAH